MISLLVIGSILSLDNLTLAKYIYYIFIAFIAIVIFNKRNKKT